jgi:replicative DNA helicase
LRPVLTPDLLAERAALGALMLHGDDDPAEWAVLRWLRPDDFHDPWHREVHRALRDQAAAMRAIDARTIGLRLLERLGPTRADLPRVAGLLRATPPHPDAAAYARMVLDTAGRREIAGLGVLLRAGALTATLAGSPRPLHGVTAAVEARIADVEQRWQQAHQPAVDRGPVPAAVRGRSRSTEVLLGADRLLSAHPVTAPAVTAEREADLIAALINRTAAIDAVRSWLVPDAVTNLAWRPVYAAVLDLDRRGEVIDPVTVLWQVTRGPVAAGCVTAHQVLARVESVLARDPGHLAHQVAVDHLRLRADTAAAAMRDTAGDRTRALPEVLVAARAENTAVRSAARPLAGPAPVRIAPRQSVAPAVARSLEAG